MGARPPKATWRSSPADAEALNSLHAPEKIPDRRVLRRRLRRPTCVVCAASLRPVVAREHGALGLVVHLGLEGVALLEADRLLRGRADRKSTRLNSSHSQISYAVF